METIKIKTVREIIGELEVGGMVKLDGVEVTKERAEEFTNETLMCVNSNGLDWVIEEMRRLKYE